MKKRYVPGLGHVSAIGAGCWTIGGLATNDGVPVGWTGVDEDEAYSALVRAHDLGITLYDTAGAYGLGQSERLVGRLLTTANRDRLTVSSKVGYVRGNAAHPYERDQILRQFDATLDNLGTDYLDLYSLHSSDFGPDHRYLGEAAKTLRELRDQGLIKAIGMRAPHEFCLAWAEDVSHPRCAEASAFMLRFAVVQPDVLTVRYNMLSPLYEPMDADIFDLANECGVGVLIKQALGQGLLVGAHRTDLPRTFPLGDHRRGDPKFSPAAVGAVRHGLRQLGADFGYTRADLTRMALQYALQRSENASLLVGFRTAQQISVNVAAVGDPLTAPEIDQIQSVMAPVRETIASLTDTQEKSP
ncbi:aldo/keto reductase [Kitasatospora sp. NPDC058184]|uniref:aldo/keto reductase n=1 Tax=Kitasatospora sp. NPDC058184 TaxID=3346370 RepID=UPI0036D7D046